MTSAAGSFDIHAEVRDGDGDLDDGWFESFEEQLLERFAASPEGQALGGELCWSGCMMGFGKDYHGVTVAEMSADDFEEIVSELFPRKLSCDPREALSIIAELRAFWTFLEREFRLPNARACLDVLHADAAKRLERALSDPGNFGIAKSYFMAGEQAGFDMSSNAGAQEWMSTYNAMNAAGGALELFARPARSVDERRIKRNKRKAQRASRKRNR